MYNGISIFVNFRHFYAVGLSMLCGVRVNQQKTLLSIPGCGEEAEEEGEVRIGEKTEVSDSVEHAPLHRRLFNAHLQQICLIILLKQTFILQNLLGRFIY